jgi:hypothetical protein
MLVDDSPCNGVDVILATWDKVFARLGELKRYKRDFITRSEARHRRIRVRISVSAQS